MSTTTHKIPASVTYDHAYAYGYLSASFSVLETVVKNTNENDLWDLQYALKRLREQVQYARELDAEMTRRADERMKQIFNA